MMLGMMMPRQLTITSVLRHGQTFHANQEIVSRRGDGSLHRYRFADMGRRIAQLAHALVRLGVRDGDRVATLAWNTWRHVETYYAVSCMGAVCHTLNPRLFADQLTYIVDHAEDSVLLFDLAFTKLVEKLAPQLPTVKHWVALCEADELPQSSIPGLIAYEALIADAPVDYDWPDLDERQACGLCYTSGTTGKPKGVLFDHRSQVIHALAVSGGDWLALRARDAALPVVPMFHACAWGFAYTALMNGFKLILPGPALDGESLHELMEAEKATLVAGVPTIWMDLLRHLKATGGRLSTVERLMVGGSAAPLSMIRAFEQDYGVTVIHGWGMTELSPVGSLSSLKDDMEALPAEERFRIKSLQGRPLYGVEMRIVDGAGKVLPHDGKSVGNLHVRGPWIAGGYFKNDSAQSFTADGWFETGDVGTIDAEGFLRLTDRTKDVIKSGGEWISSIEIENVAISHPSVREAACIAASHSKWGERPLLLVVPAEGKDVDKAELLRFFEGKVATWWIPDDVVVVEELPHTATGKLSKRTLRETLAGYVLPTDKDA